jgi:hypothetical protein
MDDGGSIVTIEIRRSGGQEDPFVTEAVPALRAGLGASSREIA